jgi:hypothetical protein
MLNLNYLLKSYLKIFQDETSMSESLRAIDKSAAQNKNIKEKLKRFESVFDR